MLKSLPGVQSSSVFVSFVSPSDAMSVAALTGELPRTHLRELRRLAMAGCGSEIGRGRQETLALQISRLATKHGDVVGMLLTLYRTDQVGTLTHTCF